MVKLCRHSDKDLSCMPPCRQDDAFLAKDVPKDGSLCGPPTTTSHGFWHFPTSSYFFVSPCVGQGLQSRGAAPDKNTYRLNAVTSTCVFSVVCLWLSFRIST